MRVSGIVQTSFTLTSYADQQISLTPISSEVYGPRVNLLMGLPRLRDMAPLWLSSAVKHIAKPLVGEERNLIKKGWDQLYLEPMNVDGFLEKARGAHLVAMEEQSKLREKLKFQEQTLWMAKYGNIDDFVPSWERGQGMVLVPLAPEVLEVSKFWA